MNRIIFIVQVLELLKPPQDESQRSGLHPKNVVKNRSADIIPSNTDFDFGFPWIINILYIFLFFVKFSTFTH